MTANPLVDGVRNRPGGVTIDMLNDLAARLNRTRFVADSGAPYYVGLMPDGKACLDRKMSAGRA